MTTTAILAGNEIASVTAITAADAQAAIDAINMYMAAWPAHNDSTLTFRKSRVIGIYALRGEDGRIFWVPEFDQALFTTIIFVIEGGRAQQYSDAYFFLPKN